MEEAETLALPAPLAGDLLALYFKTFGG